MPVIAIAPMLDWSDRHYRYFMRQITKSTILYTEMIVADAILHGNLERLLSYDKEEHPLVLQLGGSSPDKLAKAARICASYGYDAINLNVGCPSDRVKSGNFGACLMQDPQLVAACVHAMRENCTLPVTVKHRIGINYNEDYVFVRDFVATVAESGCNHFIVHARNAILGGLSPKRNRVVPALKYDYVYRLKQDFPMLEFVINGGVKTCTQIQEHLKLVDGVMLGREAYYNPYLFHDFDQIFFKHSHTYKTRLTVAQAMLPYLEKAASQNIPLHRITRHMIGLYHGCPNAKIWRYTLTNRMVKENSLQLYKDLLTALPNK